MDNPVDSINQPLDPEAAAESPAPIVSSRLSLTWDEWMDRKSRFDENRSRFPVQQLVPYLGQMVAWQPDGSAIRDSASKFGALWDKIEAQGDDPSMYTYEDIPIV